MKGQATKNNEKTILIAFRIPERMLSKIEEMCEKEYRDRTNVINKIIIEHFSKRRKK